MRSPASSDSLEMTALCIACTTWSINPRALMLSLFMTDIRDQLEMSTIRNGLSVHIVYTQNMYMYIYSGFEGYWLPPPRLAPCWLAGLDLLDGIPSLPLSSGSFSALLPFSSALPWCHHDPYTPTPHHPQGGRESDPHLGGGALNR